MDYSKEYIEHMMQLSYEVTSRPILTLVAAMLQLGKCRSPEVKTDIDTLHAEFLELRDRLSESQKKHVSIGIPGLDRQKLLIGLEVKPKGFMPEIMLPPDYENDLYKQYEMLRLMAVAYWEAFRHAHADLIERISVVLPDLTEDLMHLKISADNLTALYFSANSPLYVSIVAGYVDI